MPVRYIDPDKIYDIDVNGTIFKVKQIFPQSDIFLLDKHRMKVVANGQQEDYDAIVEILSKYVVDIGNKPDDDIKKCLTLMDANDLTELLKLMQNKSTFEDPEEKN